MQPRSISSQDLQMELTKSLERSPDLAHLQVCFDKPFPEHNSKRQLSTMPQQRGVLLTLLAFVFAQGEWFLGDLSKSCSDVCQSNSLSCFNDQHDAVNTDVKTLFVSSEELNIDCLAVDAVEESEGFPSLPRVLVDNDNDESFALCQYTVANSPVSLCSSIPPAAYRRFCCCGTSAEDCPTSDEDPSAITTPTDAPADGDDDDGGEKFDFWGIFGIFGLILAVLGAIGGLIWAAVVGFVFGESDSN